MILIPADHRRRSDRNRLDSTERAKVFSIERVTAIAAADAGAKSVGACQ